MFLALISPGAGGGISGLSHLFLSPSCFIYSDASFSSESIQIFEISFREISFISMFQVVDKIYGHQNSLF